MKHYNFLYAYEKRNAVDKQTFILKFPKKNRKIKNFIKKCIIIRKNNCHNLIGHKKNIIFKGFFLKKKLKFLGKNQFF